MNLKASQHRCPEQIRPRPVAFLSGLRAFFAPVAIKSFFAGGLPTNQRVDAAVPSKQTKHPPDQSASRLIPSGSMRIAFWACFVIAVAAVLRRVAAIAFPSRSLPTQLAALDAYFASHAQLTLAHILCALAFVLITPWIILWPGRSAWAEKTIFPLGAIVGVTAYAMSVHAVGGWLERSAVLFFNTLFLFTLSRAWLYCRQGNAVRNQEWLLRSIVILLGIATTRPIMGIFFATSHLTHLQPQQFFGIAFWIGFSINAIAIELWLRSRRSHSAA